MKCLARAVAFHYGLDKDFQERLDSWPTVVGVLGQAVAAVTERGVVVMAPDAWVEAHTVDDGFRVQPLHFGVRVQFVEVGYPQGQVGVGKEFHGLGFGQSHEQRVDVLLIALLAGGGKVVCGFVQPGVSSGGPR